MSHGPSFRSTEIYLLLHCGHTDTYFPCNIQNIASKYLKTIEINREELGGLNLGTEQGLQC